MFLEAKGRQHIGVHNMRGTIGKKPPLPWVFCLQCGLLNLKNDVTHKALKRPCIWED